MYGAEIPVSNISRSYKILKLIMDFRGKRS